MCCWILAVCCGFIFLYLTFVLLTLMNQNNGSMFYLGGKVVKKKLQRGKDFSNWVFCIFIFNLRIILSSKLAVVPKCECTLSNILSLCGLTILAVFFLSLLNFVHICFSFVNSKCTSHVTETQKMSVLLWNRQGSYMSCMSSSNVNLVTKDQKKRK